LGPRPFVESKLSFNELSIYARLVMRMMKSTLFP